MEDILYKDQNENNRNRFASTTITGANHHNLNQQQQRQRQIEEALRRHNAKQEMMEQQQQQLLASDGHDSETHDNIIKFVLVIAVVIQLLLFLWKMKYPRSFLRWSLFGIWLFPMLFSVYNHFYRFLFIWTLFTLYITYLFKLSTQQPLGRSTPKTVYMSFYFTYLISYGLCFGGGLLFIVLVFSQTDIENWIITPDILVFYGLYFGVLGRDFAEICSNRIASILGLGASRLPITKVSDNNCSICTGHLDQSNLQLNPDNEGLKKHKSLKQKIFNILINKKSCKLQCGHGFHVWCIRGWALVGKNGFCPNCSEKVDYKSVCKNPWEKTDLAWGLLLDMCRYIVVWNPIILFISQGLTFILDKSLPS